MCLFDYLGVFVCLIIGVYGCVYLSGICVLLCVCRHVHLFDVNLCLCAQNNVLLVCRMYVVFGCQCVGLVVSVCCIGCQYAESVVQLYCIGWSVCCIGFVSIMDRLCKHIGFYLPIY